jgi:hypothetical protein
MKNVNENARKVLAMLRSANGAISALGLFRLIRLTSKITAPTIAVLHNYTSDKSDNTELADYTLNVGTKYENAKSATLKTVANLDLSDMLAIADQCTPTAIKGFQYIDRKGMTAEAYCTAVKAMIPQAIEEMRTVTPRPNDAVIHLNKVLSFNINTGHLLLAGELINGGKRVAIEGDVKLTAKAPKTVAKEVIRTYLNARTNKVRSFIIDNLNTISVGGEKIALNVG